jgi:hypothetical protein
MQRALLGIADRVLPLMGGEALRQWACCAMDALRERDAEGLRQKLPPLLKACDERMLASMAPVAQEKAAFEAQRTEEHVLSAPTPAPDEDEVVEVRPSVETQGLGGVALAEGRQTLDAAPRTAEPKRATLMARVVLGLNPSEPADACDERSSPGASSTNLSDCWTGSCASPPEEGLQPEPPPAGSRGPIVHEVRGAGGPLDETRGQHHRPTAEPKDCAPPAAPHVQLRPFDTSSMKRGISSHQE